MRDIGPYYETLAAKLGQRGAPKLDPIYLELAEKMSAKESKYIPLILSKLATPEQARLIHELPASPEEISRWGRCSKSSKLIIYLFLKLW